MLKVLFLLPFLSLPWLLCGQNAPKMEEKASVKASHTIKIRKTEPAAPKETRDRRPRTERVHIKDLYPNAMGVYFPENRDGSYDLRFVTIYKDKEPRYWEKTKGEFQLDQLPSQGRGSADSLIILEYGRTSAGSMRNRNNKESVLSTDLQPFALRDNQRGLWQLVGLDSLYKQQNPLNALPKGFNIVRYELAFKDKNDRLVYSKVLPNGYFDRAWIPDFVTKVEFHRIEASKPHRRNRLKDKLMQLPSLSFDAEALRLR